VTGGLRLTVFGVAAVSVGVHLWQALSFVIAVLDDHPSDLRFFRWFFTVCATC
jgi:hypothetical protein